MVTRRVPISLPCHCFVERLSKGNMVAIRICNHQRFYFGTRRLAARVDAELLGARDYFVNVANSERK